MPAFTTTERLKMLEHVMLHPQLTDADRRIYWYLILKLLNEETGLCYCANSHLAKLLSLTDKTVRRSKAHLKQLGLISYASGKADHTATSYKLHKHTPAPDIHVRSSDSAKMYTDVRGTSMSGVTDQNVRSTPDTHVPSSAKTPDNHVRRSKQEQIHHGFYASFQSPEWDYWDAFLRKTTGKGACRDKRGGWHFPTQWPSETRQ